MRFAEGTPIRVEMTKWGEQPHWAFAGRYLGLDRHGEWLGFHRGTHHARPGQSFDSDVDSVTLLVEGLWAVPTFHSPGLWCQLYADIATPPVWDGDVVRAVDLDLDVIRMSDATPGTYRRPPGEIWVDDEDEFEEHRVAFGYPDDVVSTARSTTADLVAAVRAGHPPYDGLGSARRWLERLAALP